MWEIRLVRLMGYLLFGYIVSIVSIRSSTHKYLYLLPVGDLEGESLGEIVGSPDGDKVGSHVGSTHVTKVFKHCPLILSKLIPLSHDKELVTSPFRHT